MGHLPTPGHQFFTVFEEWTFSNASLLSLIIKFVGSSAFGDAFSAYPGNGSVPLCVSHLCAVFIFYHVEMQLGIHLAFSSPEMPDCIVWIEMIHIQTKVVSNASEAQLTQLHILHLVPPVWYVTCAFLMAVLIMLIKLLTDNKDFFNGLYLWNNISSRIE